MMKRGCKLIVIDEFQEVKDIVCVCDKCLKSDVCSKQEMLREAFKETKERYVDIEYFSIGINCKHFASGKKENLRGKR